VHNAKESPLDEHVEEQSSESLGFREFLRRGVAVAGTQAQRVGLSQAGIVAGQGESRRFGERIRLRGPAPDRFRV
jgi:hypothetical protein